MTQESKITEAYPLSALFINACNQEVTKDRIGSLFEVLNIPCQAKLAEMFEMSPAKFNEIILTVSAASAQTAAAPAAAQKEVKAAPKKEEEKEEEQEEDANIDFGDMFA